jgi:alpha-glucoside transport system permease protein
VFVAADSRILAGTTTDAFTTLGGVVLAVGGFLIALFVIFFFASRVRGRPQRPLTILICLGPAVALATIGLVIPAIVTVVYSFKDQQALGTKSKFIGFKNYQYDFTDSETLHTLLRTLEWIIIVPTAAVVVGLTIALLTDRLKRPNLVKTLIFLPTAISFVGAALIWAFVYNYVEPGQGNPQSGLLSQIVITLGWAHPPNWLATSPLNSYLEMVILVWIEAGFAMVVLGAGLKAIPDEILEAARMDGATGVKLFRTVQIPMIRNTLIVVVTTIMIATLKIFDIVNTINDGNFDTDILANKLYDDIFVQQQLSRGSSLAVILFVCVTPLIVFNVVQLRKERSQ